MTRVLSVAGDSALFLVMALSSAFAPFWVAGLTLVGCVMAHRALKRKVTTDAL